MIISHKHKFIFIKTRKTGSTSVEIALSRIVSSGDVVTPITPRDELMRMALGSGCQNYVNEPTIEERYSRELANDCHRVIPSYIRQAQRFRNHMSLAEVLAEAEQDLSDYKVISIERHPYEKAVSLANFQIGFRSYSLGGAMFAEIDRIQETVSHLIDSGSLESGIRNWDLYCLSGKVQADCMLQHQSLDGDFESLLQSLQIAADRTHLPSAKCGNRDRTIEPQDILTPVQRQQIQQICAEEFEHFSYAR